MFKSGVARDTACRTHSKTAATGVITPSNYDGFLLPQPS
jgi:hypothetical protein